MNRTVWMVALAAILVAGAPALAGDDEEPPAEVTQVFSALRSSWQSRSAEGVAQFFGEMVGLYLDGQANGTFKRKQAPGVLHAYFDERIDSVQKLEHKRYRQGSGWSETLKYEYVRRGEREAVKGTLTLQIRSDNGRWILESAHVGG